MATAEKRSLSIEARLRDQLTGPLGKVGRSIRGFGVAGIKSFEALAKSVLSIRTAIVGLGGVLAARGLARGFLSIAEGLDNVAKTSDRLGVTTESLLALRNQAELTGVEFDQLSQALLDLQKNVGAASDGASEQQRLLLKLGLTTRDFAGRQLDAVEILAKLADGLQLVSNQTDRARILTTLLGESGGRLVPLLNQGSTAIRRQADELREFGGAFSREQLANVEAFNDSLREIQQTFRLLLESVVIELAPALTRLFRTLKQEVVENAGPIRAAVADLIEVLISGIQLLGEAASTVRQVFLGYELLGAAVVRVKEQFTGSDDSFRQAEERLQAIIVEINTMSGASEESAARLHRLRQALEDIRSGEGLSGTGIAIETPTVLEPPIPPGFFDNLSAGIEQASQKWRDFTQTAFQSGQQLVDGPLSAFQNALGSIIDGTKSGSEAFKDFGRETLKILAQVISRLLIVRLLSAVFPGAAPAPAVTGVASGGVIRGRMGEPVPLRSFAQGGIATGPTLALFGEGRQAEAFVPLPDGKNIPVSFVGHGAGGSTNNHYYIDAVDARSVQRLFLEQSPTVVGIVENGMQVRNRFRQVVRKTSR